MRKQLALVALAVLPALSGCALPIIAAGVGAGALAANDPRSAGTQFDDKAIGLRATNALNAQFGDQGHIVATSYDRQVLLTGQVGDAAMKAKAEAVVRGVGNVRQVYNQLDVGFSTSLSTRAVDTWITSEVKARLVGEQSHAASQVKVVTENGVVYLMGLVSRADADDAVNVASSSRGVKKVVKLFEIAG